MMIHQNNEPLKEKWLLICSFFLGLCLFFTSPRTAPLFSNAVALEQNVYFHLANTIFQPNYSFYSESLLLPLIAKLVGAASSSYAFHTLCVIITILILPNVAYRAQIYFNNISQATLLVLIFALCLRYLHFFDLGMPDPLTILLITVVGLSRAPRQIFYCSCLAGLTHFSIASLGLCACAGLVFFCPSLERKTRHHFAAAIICGLTAAKSILLIWFFVFEYQLNSRLDIVLDQGAGYFFREIWPDQIGFLLIPGIPFLAIYGLLFFFFLFSKQIFFALAMLVALLCSYTGMFFSEDGLRVFTPIVVGSLLLALREAVNVLYSESLAGKLLGHLKASLRFLQQLKYLAVGLVAGAAWLIVTLRAKSKGLLINETNKIYTVFGETTYMELYLWFVAVFVAAAIAVPRLRVMTKYIQGVTFIAMIPLFIVCFQFARQIFFPTAILGIFEKSTIFGLMVILTLTIFKLDLLAFLTKTKTLLDRLKTNLFQV
jgi:hypothetical protein